MRNHHVPNMAFIDLIGGAIGDTVDNALTVAGEVLPQLPRLYWEKKLREDSERSDTRRRGTGQQSQLVNRLLEQQQQQQRQFKRMITKAEADKKEAARKAAAKRKAQQQAAARRRRRAAAAKTPEWVLPVAIGAGVLLLTLGGFALKK